MRKTGDSMAAVNRYGFLDSRRSLEMTGENGFLDSRWSLEMTGRTDSYPFAFPLLRKLSCNILVSLLFAGLHNTEKVLLRADVVIRPYKRWNVM